MPRFHNSTQNSFVYGPLERQNPQDDKFLSSFYLTPGLIFRLGLGDLFVAQNSREFYASYFLIIIIREIFSLIFHFYMILRRTKISYISILII